MLAPKASALPLGDTPDIYFIKILKKICLVAEAGFEPATYGL
jgi:hypothetical protein